MLKASICIYNKRMPSELNEFSVIGGTVTNSVKNIKALLTSTKHDSEMQVTLAQGEVLYVRIYKR